MKGDFSADAPNTKWFTDITQTPCKDGKLYIAPIMDCFGDEIIALAMDDNMKKELCIKALKEAYELRRPGDGRSACFGTANSADNAPSNGSRTAYIVQATGEDRNAAEETEPSYTSVQTRE